jgi:hypothetical protein
VNNTAMTDSELREHLHARGWRTEAIDVPMIREACKALQEASATGAVAWLAENQDGSFDAYKDVHSLIDDCRQGFPVYATPTTSTTGKVDASRVRDEALSEAVGLYESEEVLAPVGNSAWGEAYQEGWISGAQAYREAIRSLIGTPKSAEGEGVVAGAEPTMVAIAKRNLCAYLSKASFASNVDREAALNCVEVLEQALAAVKEN